MTRRHLQHGLGRAIACLAFVMLLGTAEAQVHGCTFETAVDRTGEAVVDLDWSLGHSSCIIVDLFTEVRWLGNFSIHPLAGGVSPNSEAASPISSAIIVQEVASVGFEDAGTYPYFCEVHFGNMTGVIYVVEPPLFDDGFEGDALPGCASNDDCAVTEYCATPEAGLCGERGACESRPLICPDVWVPVCGCDGLLYGNACEAAVAGVNILFDAPCPP